MKIMTLVTFAVMLVLIMSTMSFVLAREGFGDAGVSTSSLDRDYQTQQVSSDPIADEPQIDDDGLVPMPIAKNLDIKVVPDIQKSMPDEQVSYRIVVVDLREPYVCIPEEPCAEIATVVNTYKLSVESSEEVEVDLGQEKVELDAGQKESIKLVAKSEEKGEHKFVVKVEQVENEGNYARARGILIVVSGTEPPKPPITKWVVFNGDGFILNEDESSAESLKLQLLGRAIEDEIANSKTDIVGRAHIGNPTKNFAVKGTLIGEEIELKFYKLNHIILTEEKTSKIEKAITGKPVEDLEDRPSESATGIETITESGVESEINEIENVVAEKEPYATLKGTLKKYNHLVILKGEVVDENGKEFTLTAFSKKHSSRIRQPIYLTEVPITISEVEIEEIIPVEVKPDVAEGSTEQVKKVYIQPVKVYKKRILFIPYGKNIVETNVIEGDNVQTIKIPETESASVGEYTITAESVETDNVELAITSTSA